MIILNKRRGFFLFYIFLILSFVFSTSIFVKASSDNNGTIGNSTEIIGSGNNNNNSSNSNSSDSSSSSSDKINVYKFIFQNKCNYTELMTIPEGKCTNLISKHSNNNSSNNNNNNSDDECPFKSIFIPFSNIINNETAQGTFTTIWSFSNYSCTDFFKNETLECLSNDKNNNSSSNNKNNNNNNKNNTINFQYFKVECPKIDNNSTNNSTDTPTLTPNITTTPTLTPNITITPNITTTPTLTPNITTTPTLTPNITTTPTVPSQNNTFSVYLKCLCQTIYVPINQCINISLSIPTATTTTTTTPSSYSTTSTPTGILQQQNNNNNNNNNTKCQFEFPMQCQYKSILIYSKVQSSKDQLVFLFGSEGCGNLTNSILMELQCLNGRTDFDLIKVTSCPSFINYTSPNSTEPPLLNFPFDYTILNQTYSNSSKLNGGCEFLIHYILKNDSYTFNFANFSTNVQVEYINSKPNLFIKYWIPNSNDTFPNGTRIPIGGLLIVKYNDKYFSTSIPSVVCSVAPEKLYLSPRFSVLYPYKQYYPLYEDDAISFYQRYISSLYSSFYSYSSSSSSSPSSPSSSSIPNNIFTSTSGVEYDQPGRELQGAYYSMVLETVSPIYSIEKRFKFLSNDTQFVAYRDYKSSSFNNSNNNNAYTTIQTIVIFKLNSPSVINTVVNGSSNSYQNYTYFGSRLPTITLEVSYPSNTYIPNQYFNLINPFVSSQSTNFTFKLTSCQGSIFWDGKNVSSTNSTRYSQFEFELTDTSTNGNNNNRFNYLRDDFATPRMKYNGVDSNTLHTLYGDENRVYYYGYVNPSKYVQYNISDLLEIQLYTFNFSFESIPIPQPTMIPLPTPPSSLLSSAKLLLIENSTTITNSTDNNSNNNSTPIDGINHSNSSSNNSSSSSNNGTDTSSNDSSQNGTLPTDSSSSNNTISSSNNSSNETLPTNSSSSNNGSSIDVGSNSSSSNSSSSNDSNSSSGVSSSSSSSSSDDSSGGNEENNQINYTSSISKFLDYRSKQILIENISHLPQITTQRKAVGYQTEIYNSSAQLFMINFRLDYYRQLLKVQLQPFDFVTNQYPYGMVYRNPYNPNDFNHSITKLLPHYTHNDSLFIVYMVDETVPSISMQSNLKKPFKIIDSNLTGLAFIPENGSSIHQYSNQYRYVDEKPPSLLSVSIKTLDYMNAILHIDACDNLSGVGIIKVGQVTFTSSDLVKGTVFNGSFEKYLNYFNFPNYHEIILIDNVGNQKIVPYPTNWPIVEPGSIYAIDFILSSNGTNNNNNNNNNNSNINNSDSNNENNEDRLDESSNSDGYIYTVVLKYSNSLYGKNPSLNDLSFTPGFQFFYNSDSASKFLKSPSNYLLMKWSSQYRGYVVDFYLPSYLSNQAIQYQIISSGKVYDTSSLTSLLGYKAAVFKSIRQLKYDTMPPIVRQIKRTPENGIKYPNQNDDPISWEIQILDTSGFQSGNITFTSEFDLVGYSTFFTLANAEENLSNPTTPTFKFSIPKSSSVWCRPHTYRISSLSLLGMDGQYSTTLNDLTDYINPFSWLASNLTELEMKYSVRIQCPTEKILDITPPLLYGFTTSIKTSIDVGSLNRALKVSFRIEDAQSGISSNHIPIVYLENTRGEKYDFKCIQSSNSTIHTAYYSVEIEVPFGFGIPDGLMLSVYGVSDNMFNIAGWSAYQLNKTFSFIQTTYSAIPIISKASYNPVTNTPLTIFGHNLQSQISEDYSILVEIDFGNGFIQQEVTFKSGLLLTIYPTNTTSPKFFVKVTVDGIESNKFLVTPFIPNETNNSDPFVCPNDCGGIIKGECDTDVGCKCNAGYTGADCTSTPITLDPPNINVLEPSILLETSNRISSLISVIGINEIDETGSIYKSYRFNDKSWKFSNKSNANSLYHFSYVTTFATDNGFLTNLTASLRFYDQSEINDLNVAFADLSYKVNPSSLKYSFRLSKYSFKNDQSYLQLIMEASIESSSHSDVCSCKEYGDDSTGSEYLKLQVNGQALYARFLKRQLINSKITKTTNSFLSPITTDIPYKSYSLIGINIPYYSTKAELDPDFTMVLEVNPAFSKPNPNCTNFGLTKAQISAIIAGVVIFVIALISLTIILVVRKYKNGGLTICSKKQLKSKTIKNKKIGKIKMERLN
ncbi:hypothetical protein ACTFIZ_012633 [Dictyostelium cf. discoideum]